MSRKQKIIGFATYFQAHECNAVIRNNYQTVCLLEWKVQFAGYLFCSMFDVIVCNGNPGNHDDVSKILLGRRRGESGRS